MLYAGSLVFTPPGIPVDLRDWGEWWRFLRAPTGGIRTARSSNINALDNHPVVHVAYADALAYAQWAGKELPTEAEWEFAARGGLDGAEFAWGDEFTPGGKHRANTWQGNFPHENLCEDGFERTSPVTAFPPNGYGVYDMIGNVWEWTTDWWSQQARSRRAEGVLHSGKSARRAAKRQATTRASRRSKFPARCIKGGSHLCAPNYCRRYRPAARHAAAGGYLDEPHRISLRHQNRERKMSNDDKGDEVEAEEPCPQSPQYAACRAPPLPPPRHSARLRACRKPSRKRSNRRHRAAAEHSRHHG